MLSKSLSFRLRAFEDHELCRECRSVCNEIERLHELCMQAPQNGPLGGPYFQLPDRYRALRITLIELRTRVKSLLSAPQQTKMQSVIAKLTATALDVSTKLGNRSSASKLNLKPVQQDVQSLATMLTELSVQLDKRAIGESNE